LVPLHSNRNQRQRKQKVQNEPEPAQLFSEEPESTAVEDSKTVESQPKIAQTSEDIADTAKLQIPNHF
jgi:hypothetical protein